MINRANIEIDKVAFEGDIQGFYFKISYLAQPKKEALVEITKDGEIVREFLFPAYKIWNIAAHAGDIVEGLKNESDAGLRVAGSTGFGGNVYSG